MNVNVVNNTLGTPILNASFNYSSSNSGNGWYWVNVPDNAQLCGVAPGFQQICISVGSGPSTPGIYGWLRLPPVPPDPPSNCNCWT